MATGVNLGMGFYAICAYMARVATFVKDYEHMEACRLCVCAA